MATRVVADDRLPIGLPVVFLVIGIFFLLFGPLGLVLNRRGRRRVQTVPPGWLPAPGYRGRVFYDPANPEQARLAPASIPRVNTTATGCIFTALTIGGWLFGAAFIAIAIVLFRTR